MPSYQFECKKCKIRFTQLLPVGTKEAECPDCGSVSKKIFTAPAVHFKGGGFYASSSSTNEQKKEEKSDCSSCPKKKKCEKD